MNTANTRQLPADAPDSSQAIQCAACVAALRSPGRENISFLLVDRLTVPLVGCEDHLEQFRSLCDLATEDSAALLAHRPAGGLPCPGCRHASYDMGHPIVPLGGGAVALLVCSTHQSEIVSRFRTGLEVQQQLDTSLDAY